MKNQWFEYYLGIVTVKVKGKGIERLINKLSRNDLFIWSVRRHGPETIIFKMRLNDVKKLRVLSRKSGCKIAFIKRDGLPFLLNKFKKNSGIVAGIVVFLGVIMFLSNMVWGIQIDGANPATEYKIRKQLDEIGVKVGTLQFFVDDVDTIQKKLSDHIEEITWIGVELQGTNYHFQVVEKEEPEEQKYISPRNLVAKKKAVIVDLFVEEGKPQVGVNDFVEKGQLLVSGMIGKEGEEKAVPAKGKIFGETWYKSHVTLPLKANFQVFNGNEKQKHMIKIGKITIPFWGFGKHKFAQFEVEEKEHKVNFLKWKLPISYIKKTYREKEKVTRIYSNEEAIKMAKEMARKDLKNQLDEDAEIKGEKVLHQAIENGKVNLSIHFQIIENIAVGKPIIQGD
ncbi:sporulation protein YqfD [Bacillus aquiflavi]|uniref:Sporulation protein YqfD n=1 Tax=Bacillus aquiflavi TaxID=2672567 RepID=A0A6B3VV78_9BACI|nr:sporulation protein YqfD [Bacillus aquiflavi]MBA4535872.1 sporulation protein YqfD [Bacillus aquiflavi]NEY80247.1 sporulation protein YqfD [Bacillus aquiflavi]UAC47293.1 sporulation protein YqfD [Bacillus aquiflavi]